MLSFMVMLCDRRSDLRLFVIYIYLLTVVGICQPHLNQFYFKFVKNGFKTSYKGNALAELELVVCHR